MTPESLNLSRNSKVYIVAPAGHATGGPEALHSLAFCLKNDFGFDARMIYIPQSSKFPIHPNYIHYSIPLATEIEDNEDNLIVLSDFYHHWHIAKSLTKIKLAIWWLSVDFFFVTYSQSSENPLSNLISRIGYKFKKLLINRGVPVTNNSDYIDRAMRRCYSIDLLKIPVISRASLHLAQSAYAKCFLASNNINSEFVGDKINSAIINSPDFLSTARQNVVLYNPKKGGLFTKKLLDRYSTLLFRPISNLNTKQLVELMKSAKVFIDFGPHPGRDRIPREAALLGCCIVTGLRGSSSFSLDLPIPCNYKIHARDENIDQIGNLLNDIMENFDQHYVRFDPYREFIRLQDAAAYSDLYSILNVAQ